MAPKGPPSGPTLKGTAPPAPSMMMPGSAPKIVISPLNFAADNNWPEADTRVTLSFHIKNNGQGRVENIPWAIHDASTNKTLKTGTQAALAPGEIVYISTVWQPGSSGPHLLQAYVDPSGTALKNAATQTVLTLNFIVPSPGTHFLRVAFAGVGRPLARIWGHGGAINCDSSGAASQGSNYYGTCYAEVFHGTTVQLQASPYSPWVFRGWSTNCRATRESLVEGICEVQVNAATSVSATIGPQ